MGVPVETPSKTPDSISTSSGSRRCVVNLFCPGFRLSNQCWIIAASIATPGGHPSTVAPSAGPWLSPQVVTRNRCPKLFMLILMLLALGLSNSTTFKVQGILLIALGIRNAIALSFPLSLPLLHTNFRLTSGCLWAETHVRTR